MSRVSINPLRVIEQTEHASGPSTTIVHTIVAVDRETDKCWTDTNVLLKLSDVEEWPRPQDDVFNTPINIVESSTIAANGEIVKETLLPQQPTAVNTNVSEHHISEQPQIQQQPIHATEQIQQTIEKSAIDLMIEKMVAKTGKLQPNKQKTFSTQITISSHSIDIESLLLAADIVGISGKETIVALLLNNAIDFEIDIDKK